MNACDVVKQAYKHGYNDALKDMAKRLKDYRIHRDGLAFKIANPDIVEQIKKEMQK